MKITIKDQHLPRLNKLAKETDSSIQELVNGMILLYFARSDKNQLAEDVLKAVDRFRGAGKTTQKFTEKEFIRTRELRAKGFSYREIARAINKPVSTIITNDQKFLKSRLTHK